MKLIKANKTKTDCGVVGAFNAAQWFGIQCTYERVLKLALASGYDPGGGMYSFQFSNLLKKIGVPAKKIAPKSPAEMVERLKLGHMLVVFYIPNESSCGHILSCLMDYEGKVFVVNPEKGKGSERRTWYTFIKDMESNGTREFHVYDIPCKRRIRLAIEHDDSRTA